MLQSRPTGSWAFGLVLSGAGLIGLLWTLKIEELQLQAIWFFLALCLGVILLLLGDFITTKADLANQTITITRQNLVFPARQMHLHLKQVHGVEVHIGRNRNGHKIYNFVLRLQSGKFTPLMSGKSWSEAKIHQMAHRLGRFIDKPVSEKDFGWRGYLGH